MGKGWRSRGEKHYAVVRAAEQRRQLDGRVCKLLRGKLLSGRGCGKQGEVEGRRERRGEETRDRRQVTSDKGVRATTTAEHSICLPVRLGGWVGDGGGAAESLGSVDCSLAQQQYMNVTTTICPTTRSWRQPRRRIPSLATVLAAFSGAGSRKKQLRWAHLHGTSRLWQNSRAQRSKKTDPRTDKTAQPSPYS